MAIRSVFDALYGSISFDDDLATLISTPIIQRLRHVRLSNIDSLSMPGIANSSRYEHILGVAHLATELGVTKRLLHIERTGLVAAAALHDWAITAFGHLVEEAYQFAGTSFNHEEKLAEIISGNAPDDLGGTSRQILFGRPTGLPEWARRVAGNDDDELIKVIVDNIRGKGRYGKVISGDIDIDNIDNVFRVAHHIGMAIDKKVPLHLARSITGVDSNTGTPIFASNATEALAAWVDLRSEVYSMLMPAEYDFAGKIMLLSAAVNAIQTGVLADVDWSMTDHEFLAKMLSSVDHRISGTTERWLCGELWDISPLHWFEGARPSFPKLLAFSQLITERLGRHCFAYGIKDKRNRKLNIQLDNGDTLVMGTSSNQWLFGNGSAKRFSIKETAEIISVAEEFFNTREIGPYHKIAEGVDSQLCLL